MRTHETKFPEPQLKLMVPVGWADSFNSYIMQRERMESELMILGRGRARSRQLVWIERAYAAAYNEINCHTCLPFWWRHLTRSLNLISAGEFKPRSFFTDVACWQHLSAGFTITNVPSVGLTAKKNTKNGCAKTKALIWFCWNEHRAENNTNSVHFFYQS